MSQFKTDEYTLKARIYPTLVAMILPAVITFAMLWPYLDYAFTSIDIVKKILTCFLPVALVYSAVSFFFWSLAQSISKKIIQQPKFRQDETNMPTTVFLLWSDVNLSTQFKQKIHEKVLSKYGLRLFSPTKEKNNLEEAKRTIVDAVGRMREDTRKDEMLLRYNIKYGFRRNYLGASILSIVFTLFLWSINIWVNHLLPNLWFYYGGILHIILFGLMYWSVTNSAEDYAKQLFRAFLKDNV